MSAYFTVKLIFATIMGHIVLFGTINGSNYTISGNFYLYLQYFQQKVFYFSKISRSKIDPKYFHALVPTSHITCYNAAFPTFGFFFFCGEGEISG